MHRDIEFYPHGREPRELQPWEAAFCEWLIRSHPAPSMDEQCEKASELCQKVVTKQRIKSLKRRKKWKDHYKEFAAKQLKRARQLVESDAPWYAKAHQEAAEHLIKNGEYKEVSKFTVPVLGHVLPKQNQQVQATQVTINLSPSQQAILDGEAVDVTHEVLPADG